MRSSDSGNFLLVDKAAVQLLRGTKGEFHPMDALTSFQVDINCNKKWSYKGYSELWSWNKGKVKRFVDALLSPEGLTKLGYVELKKPIHIIQNANEPQMNHKRTINRPPKSANQRDDSEQMNHKRTTNEPRIDPTIETETETKTTAKNIHAQVMDLKPSFFSSEEWKELYRHRTKKKATQTTRAYLSLIKEFNLAHKNGMTANSILDAMSAGKGWAGFKYEWVMNSKQSKPLNGKRRKTTIDAFNGMMENINGNNNNGKTETRNSAAAVGPLGLPLPE